MTDKDGVTLESGDRVVYRPGGPGELDVGVGASVLRIASSNRCVIRLDGWEVSVSGELQDAFEVEGSTLTFMDHESGDDE
jgi:hypothetical protein